MAHPSGHFRWGVVALLFATAMVNNLDRMVLSVLAPALKDSLSFGAVEYSYIVSAFLAAYAVGYLFCGRILDRVGVKTGLAVALFVWSFAAIGHAAAVGWLSLAAFRFLLGFGESFNSPAGTKAIAEWVPRRERGLSMAIFSNGNVLGSMIAPPLVAWLSLSFGWRWAFAVTGLLGFVLWIVWQRCYRPPTSAERVEPPSVAVADESAAKKMRQLSVRFFWVRFLTDPIVYFFVFWLPSYLQDERGFSLAMIGAVGWLPFLASDVGGPGGGALSDWLVRRGWNVRRARLAIMLFAACCTPAAILAVLTSSAPLALGAIALVFGAQSCWMANQLTLISESVPSACVGRLLARSALGGSLGGIVANLLAGRIIANVGYVPVFCALGVVHLVAWMVLVGKKGNK